MFSRRGVVAVGQLLHSARRQTLFRCKTRSFSRSCQCHAKQGQAKQQEGESEPIPFSTSKAASWSMTNTVMAPKRDIPWYQPLSVVASVSVFLIYFLVLREENDLDVELNYSLFERVPQLEEHQLKLAIDYNRREGKDIKDLESRLAELQRQKQTQTTAESS